ncbi:ribosome biogenesis GTPase YlqF [Roseateles sp. DB2]|uniref:ribosome biogenesis GTPase YlqF n=1 Tax=Roseateles sp. DB2 TaxID=3453717 RepID=UPI003EE8B5AA
MAIQWFPGHMHATRKAIKERMKQGIDVVIELVDARLPGSSANPLLASLTDGKPSLKLLNKQDLADPARTQLWLDHYNAQPGTRAMPLDAGNKAPAKALVAACRELAPLRGGMSKPLRILICGIPNVGKSTLINTLVGKKSAKTGDEPGITKVEQRIVLDQDAYLFDTPGMLWPRINIPESGYKLAASGAVGRNALDEEEVALELLDYLRVHYAPLLQARYKLEGAVETLKDDALLEAIGRKRGAVLGGGRVNMQKAAEILMYDFRQGVLGRISLETPEEFKAWAAAAAIADAERERLAQEKKAQRKGRSSRDSWDAPEAE